MGLPSNRDGCILLIRLSYGFVVLDARRVSAGPSGYSRPVFGNIEGAKTWNYLSDWTSL